MDEFAVVGGQTNVSKVISWGQNPWSNMTEAFSGCTSLSDISTTSFISSTQGDMVRMFNGCTSLLEADIRNWNLTAGADWYGGSPFRGLVNLQKLDMTGVNIKLISRSDYAFAGIGTAVADGCEFLMSGLNMSTSTATVTPFFVDASRIKPTSDFSNWVFSPNGFDATGMFRSIQLTGTNSILNCSGWSTYSGSSFPSFQSSNSGAGNTGAKVDFTNLNVSNINSLQTAFQSSDFSGIIGLSTWGATAGNVSMYRAFYVAEYFKFSNSDNFSSAFIESLTPTGTYFRQAFDRTGSSLAYDPANGVASDYGDAPNITNIDLSGVSDISAAFTYSKFKNVPDLASATFNSSGVSFYQLFLGARFSDANSHFDLSNATVKITNGRQMTQSTWLSNVTFGDNVDFSACTDVYRAHYYMDSSATGDNTQPVTITYPTVESGLSWAALNQPLDWFNGTVGPTTGPLTTCQVDNLIRSFRTTAYGNALNVNFYQSKITEAPSVVRTLEAELVANGWTITENSTDATIPFEYPNFIEPGVATAPTNNTGSPSFAGTFSSSDPTNIPVNSSTGVINTTNTGNATIRYTLSDGCYTEQAILVASPFITSWNIDSDFVNQTFNFRRATTGTANNNTYFDYQIDWGDGSAMESFTDNTTPTHTYTSAGTYDIKVVGMIPGMQLAYRSGNQFFGRPEAEKLLEIKKWGDCKFSSFYYGFGGCKNMTITATDNPTFRQAGVSGYMNNFFRGCYSITSYDFTPWQTMLENLPTGGIEYLCSGAAKMEYVKLPSCTMRNTGSNYNDSIFNSVGLQAGIEILNAGSGLSTGVLTTTDTGNFAIRVNEVDSNGSAIDGRIGLYNADGWTENAVFNFTGGLQVKLTKARPGCNIIMKDITWSTRPLIRSFMYNAVVDNADLSGWTIDKIQTMQQWFFINNANYQQMTVNMDNWTATGDGITSMRTMMLGNRYNSYPFTGPKILKTTNWDSSVTENLISFDTLGNTADGRSSRLREWWGLDQIKIGKVNTFTRLFENMYYIIFSSQNGRNFSNNCFSNRVSTPSSMSAVLMCSNMSRNVDFSQVSSDAEIINLSGWTFDAGSPCSMSQAFYRSNHPGDDTTASGGIWWDLSSTDMSNVNSLSSAFRNIGLYPTSSPYGNRPTEKRTVKINDLSTTLTSMTYLGQQSTITDYDFTGCDLSNVTTLERVFSANINRQSPKEPYTFTYSNTGNLNSVTNGVSFVDGSTPLRSTDYDNVLRALGSTSVTNGDFRSGTSTYDGGLIFTDGRTPEQMTDTTTANKVVDENKNFVELGVSVGDIVEIRRANSNPIVYASITAVSETELTLSASIITDNNYRYYNIQTSDAAKDRFALDVTNSWYISDGGPTIE